MRQVGVLAAPGIIALTEMVDRLKEDHQRAKRLALAIADMPGVKLNPDHVQTNLIIFDFDHPQFSISEFLSELEKREILAMAVRGGIRFVVHKDIHDHDIEKAIFAFKNILT